MAYETIVHEWFEEVWNKKNAAGVIGKILTDETLHYGLTGPGGEPVKGIEAFEEFHRGLIEAFPDLHVEIEDVVRTAINSPPATRSPGHRRGRCPASKRPARR